MPPLNKKRNNQIKTRYMELFLKTGSLRTSRAGVMKREKTAYVLELNFLINKLNKVTWYDKRNKLKL